MPKIAAATLRRKAALCRRAASISSDGGKEADRILLRLADQLEREAATILRLAETIEVARDAD